jgi:hypothetical protein
MKKIFLFSISIILLANFVLAEEANPASVANAATAFNLENQAIFDDALLIEGYAKKYNTLSLDIILEMIKDDTLSSLKTAAAVRVFKEKYSKEVVATQKSIVEKILLKRLTRTDSPFVQVEILHALCLVDRYRYFKSMVPALLLKLDHYNSAVYELSYRNLLAILETPPYRPREARIVFNTLRNILFLSRRRLAEIKEPNQQLKQKLQLVRWAIKVLGNQELKRLPKEVIGLL